MNDFRVNFIGIGVQRAATSWISKCLAEHPQICFSQPKETHFFEKDYYYQKGLVFYQDFFKAREGKVKGEFTTTYYLFEKVAQRIVEHFPDVKILLCLRNPVERAFSNYLYNKRRGKETAPTFSQEIARQSRYIQRGFYYRYLSRFLKYFKREQVLIMFYEDCLKDPLYFIQQVYQFLNVDSTFVPPSLHQRSNASQDTNYRFLFINKLVNQRKRLKNYWGGRALLKFLKIIGLGKLVRLILRANLRKTKKAPAKEGRGEVLRESDRERLRGIYREDIQKLEKLINHDLSFWR